MTALISGIGVLIALIAAYIAHLRGLVSQHEDTIASLKNADETKAWAEKLKAQLEEATKSDVDFQKSAEDFVKKYGDQKWGITL